jgi:hypothetical protein
MAQFGSNTGMVSQNLSTVVDPQGNQIVSSDNSFGGSPLGVAARTQALYGIPNANFNLTPSDVTIPIDTSNPLPYWEISSQGAITAEMYYDDTRQQWSVNLDPVGAGSGDFVTLKTRSYLLNDSGLSLRQKAYATLEKIGTYSSTNQWNLVLTATYFDAAGTQLSSFAIGTAAQNTTWTGINGFTTSGTAVIDAAAVYCDIDFTMTAIATVSGTVTAHIDALLLQTSVTGGGGAQSFLITETFTSSGTWTRPTGVEYLIAVIGVGGGGGGGTGKYELNRSSQTPPNVDGGGGGGGSRYLCVQNLYVGNVGSVSVGIGAGGIGGSAESVTKGSGITTTPNGGGGGGAAGGTTTFGTYFSVPGGGGAIGTPSANVGDGGAAGGTVTCSIYGFIQLTADNGAGEAGNNAGTPQPGTYSALPFTPSPSAAGANGAAGTSAGGSGTAFLGSAGSGGSAWYSGGGGGGGRTSSTSSLNRGGNGASGGGGGGGAAARQIVGTATITATAGSGGNGATGSGGGGGGGGGAVVYAPLTAVGTTSYQNSTLTATTGKGGDGGSGAVIVVYVG